MILAGWWSRSVHCPCPSTGERNTFILYSNWDIVDSDNFWPVVHEHMEVLRYAKKILHTNNKPILILNSVGRVHNWFPWGDSTIDSRIMTLINSRAFHAFVTVYMPPNIWRITPSFRNVLYTLLTFAYQHMDGAVTIAVIAGTMINVLIISVCHHHQITAQTILIFIWGLSIQH